MSRAASHAKSDILINIILPLGGGSLIYLLAPDGYGFIRNYLPDGVWAYAFASAILIIWLRNLHLLWLLLVLMAAILFEWMQFKNMLSGTGDLTDIFVYILFFLIALLLNPFFKRTFKYQNA